MCVKFLDLIEVSKNTGLSLKDNQNELCECNMKPLFIEFHSIPEIQSIVANSLAIECPR